MPERATVEYAPSASTLERIERFRARGLPIVSAYVPVGPGPDGRKMMRSEIDSLLHQVRPLANDRRLDHDARISLRGDIERIAVVGEDGLLKGGSLAIFSCSGGGLLEVVGLPRAVRTRITVDATAAIRPMLAVLAEYRRCCAVVVDREMAYAWELYLGEVLDTEALPAARPRGVGQAVNERRDDHKRQELQKRHFREVAAALERLFAARRFDVLAVGGHEDELPSFLELLPRTLRERLAGTFMVDDHNINPASARERAEAVLSRYELDELQRLLAEVLSVAAAGGPAAVGLEPCLWAASLRAVEALYVHEGAGPPGVVCDESRWLGLREEICPICGRETRRTPDVIDELVELVVEDGGSIRHVPIDSELGERVAAASLRFELPGVPEVASRGDLSSLA